MSIWKRVLLYLTRKKGRTVLLLFYIFCMSCFIFTAVFLKEGTEKELERLRNSFGAGFVLGLDADNEAYYTMAEYNGQTSKVYAGPIITDKTINAIMEIPGVVDYALSNEINMVYTKLKLQSGQWANTEPGEYMTKEELEVFRQQIAAYPCRNGSRHINFSTGALEITQGRNLLEEDSFMAVISEQLAERNHISVGDSFIIETKAGTFQLGGDSLKTWGKPIELQVIGIFHMNLVQLASEYTFEYGYLENNIYIDLETDAQLKENINDNWDVDLPESGYQEVTFFVKDPAELDGIMQEVRERKDINIEGLRFYVDSSTYQASVKPYEMVRIFAIALFFISVTGTAVVLFLLMRLWIRSRKQEAGILLSVGIKKREIIAQIVMECMGISIFALVLSILLSGSLADISAQTARHFTKQDAEKGKYEVEMDMGLYPEIRFAEADEVVLSGEVTPRAVLWLIFLMLGISSVSVLLASFQILEIEPKRLLQSL